MCFNSAGFSAGLIFSRTGRWRSGKKEKRPPCCAASLSLWLLTGIWLFAYFFENPLYDTLLTGIWLFAYFFDRYVIIFQGETYFLFQSAKQEWFISLTIAKAWYTFSFQVLVVGIAIVNRSRKLSVHLPSTRASLRNFKETSQPHIPQGFNHLQVFDRCHAFEDMDNFSLWIPLLI